MPVLKYSRGVDVEYERAPRKSVTLLVVQDQVPVRLCMHGSSDPSTWNGDVCDNDDTARACDRFVPIVGLKDAESKFMEQLQDDAFVYGRYPDIAALQWVLEDRIGSKPLSLWERLLLWHERRRTSSALPESDAGGSVPESPDGQELP